MEIISRWGEGTQSSVLTLSLAKSTESLVEYWEEVSGYKGQVLFIVFFAKNDSKL